MTDQSEIGLSPACLEYLYSRLDIVIENTDGAYDDIIELSQVVKDTVKKSEDDGTLYKAWTLVCDACKDLNNAERFLAEATALLPHANGDWRVIDCMLRDYGAPAGTFMSAEEFLTAEPPQEYKLCYDTVFYYLYPRHIWSKPTPAMSLHAEGDQEHISNLEAFWASMWRMNPSRTFVKMLDSGAPEYEKDENLQRVVTGGYKVIKALLDQDTSFDITHTDVGSDQIWSADRFGWRSFTCGDIEDKVVLQNSDLATLRIMKYLAELTGQPTVVAALIIKGLVTRELILALEEDAFVDAVASLPHAPVSLALAHKLYQTLVVREDTALELDSKAASFKEARKRDLTDPANPAALFSIDPNTGPDSSNPKHATVTELVGGGDLITLDDRLTTVTSPSAYLVDLLELLKKTPATYGGIDDELIPVNLYDLLITRRPDLPHLQLSVENTNVAMPYLDLVNEVLTQVIFAKDPYSYYTPAYFDSKLGDDSKDLIAQPLHVDYNVYSLLDRDWSVTVPIGILPYDPQLHRMRVLLRAMGTSVLELMHNFPFDEYQIGPQTSRVDNRDRITNTEFLELSSQELRLLLGSQPDNKTMIKRLWGLERTISDAEALTKLSDVRDEVLGRAGIELLDLAQILKTNYINPGAVRENGNFNEDINLKPGPLVIIDSSNGNGPPGLLSKMRLLRRDGSQATWAQLRKLMIFVRIWKHLNSLKDGAYWSVDNLDHAMTLFYTPIWESIDTTLAEINSVTQFSSLTGLDISRVLVLFGDLSMPLYREIFVRHDLAAKDPVFEWNQASGMYLGDDTIKVADHLPVLLAALRISPQDFDLILSLLRTTASEPLNFASLTTYLRVIVIRDAFGVDLRDWGSLERFRDDALFFNYSAADFLDALKEWRRLTTQIFSVGEVDFVASGQDPDKLGPDASSIISTAATLGARLTAIESQYPDVIDQDKATADAVLQCASPLFGSQLSKDIVDFLQGKRIVRIPVDPLVIPDAFEDTKKLSVSRADGFLIATGILTDKELSDALSQGQSLDWRKALESIRSLAQDFYYSTMGALLTDSPNASELEEFFLMGDDDASKTAERKCYVFLNTFTPLLRQRLVSRSVREFVDSGVLQGMAPEIVRMILAKHPPDPQSEGDLLEHTIEDSLAAVRSDVYDSREPFNGHVIPPSTDSYRFVASAGSSSNVSVTVDKTTYPFKPLFDKSQFIATDSIALTGGQAYPFSATTGIEGLQWRSLQNPQQTATIDALVKRSTSDSLGTDLSWITRFRMFMEHLNLVPCEIEAVDTRLSWIFIDYMMDYVDLRNFVLSQQDKATPGAVAQKLFSVFPLRLEMDGQKWPRYSAEDISIATGWPKSDIRPYSSFKKTDKVTWRSVLQIKSQIAIAKRMGVRIDYAYRLVDDRVEGYEYDMWDRANELTLLYNHSSQMSHTQWEKTAADTVYNELRDSQRRALVAYLLRQTWLQDVNDEDGLFEYLLIDTQMGADMVTSRTKQAISTVQLFIQRCLLGLEKGGHLRIKNLESFIQKWNWMSKYTVWEANRKVFIFPENWIDPAFRDDKSPAFEAFEGRLIKSPLTRDHITEAVLDYVHDAYEVRSLSVEATYTQRGPIDYNGRPGPIERIHYIGRTAFAPYTFYHRTFDQKPSIWTPWRKIDTQIPVIENDPNGIPLHRPGAFIIPYEFQGRLLLILPQFIAKNNGYDVKDGGVTVSGDEKTINPPAEGGVRKQWQIKLAWTEFRNNKWSPKSVCQSTLEYGYGAGYDVTLPSLYDFRFLVGRPSEILDSADQWISSYLSNATGDDTFSVWINHGTSGYAGAFVWRNGGLEVLPHTSGGVMRYADGSWPPVTYFHKAEATGGAQLRVLETSYLCRSYTVVSSSYDNDESSLKSPDVTDTKTLGGDYSYQFRNVLVPKLMPMLNVKGVFGVIRKFGEGIGDHGSELEKIEVFGGTADGRGGILFPHELRTPAAIYNWELGFHIPAMVMERAMNAQQYDTALEYARYILDPRPEHGQSSYWKWAPFSEFNPASSTVADETTVEEWESNPFQPHVIARGRPLAYKKWVVMKYIEILIAYGDSYFRQNTLESVPLAIQLYIEAAHIFGARAQKAPEIGRTRTDRFMDLDKLTFDALSNLKVRTEYVFPYAATKTASDDDGSIIPLGVASTEYFKYYSNPRMIELRALIEDRMMKIRSSMDINGVKRRLALFEPPMDPGALVAAMARSGASLSSILGGIDGPMPNCRLRHILPTALRLCHELKHLSFRYIKIRERADAEELAALKASQHTSVQSILIEMQKTEIEIAKKKLEVARDDIDAPRMRLKYYRQLLGASDLESLNEISQVILPPKESDTLRRTPLDEVEEVNRKTAIDHTQAAEVLVGITGLVMSLPGWAEMVQPFGVGAVFKYDTKKAGNAIKYVAKLLKVKAKVSEYDAKCTERASELLRRRQENTLEANEAMYEMKNMQLKIDVEESKVSAAEDRLQSLEKFADQALEVEEFLRSKYTSKELYTWLDGTYKNIHYQSYNLAYDIAKKAEKAYQFETGDANVSFIQYGYWDDSRNGLGCAEALYLDLKRLEQAQLTSRPYDFEIVKNVSLREMQPLQLLLLRETGSAEFEIPELAYDLDFPGHYFRRLKTVAVTVMGADGPPGACCCTLTLLENKYRVTPDVGGASQYARQDLGAFRSDRTPVESIAVSSGVGDSGTFRLDFDGARFLPFEGAGAVSRWRLEFPADLGRFDYAAIRDVALEVKYTSRAAGGALKASAVAAARKALADASSGGLAALLDLGSDFPDQWQGFAGGSGSHVLDLDALRTKLPFFAQVKRPSSTSVSLLTTDASLAGNELRLGAGRGPGQAFSAGSPNAGGLRQFDLAFQARISDGWKLTYSYEESESRQPLKDMWMVVRYILA
ncbi:hypothetical protein NHJ13734_001144 [Beauveria thailandica]